MPLPTGIYTPSSGYTHSIVFLHGASDPPLAFSSDIQETLAPLREAFPTFQWVYPTSETRSGDTGSSGGKAFEWFDEWDGDEPTEGWSSGGGARTSSSPACRLRDSVAQIRDVLNAEAYRLRGRWDRVILAGFGEGAAVATHALLNMEVPPTQHGGESRPGRLGAFIGVSGGMAFPGRSVEDTRRILQLEHEPRGNGLIMNTPALLQHCADDADISIQRGYILRDTLRGFGSQVEWKEYPAGRHWFNSPQGVADLVEFLREALGRDGFGEDSLVVRGDFGRMQREAMAASEERSVSRGD
jgi:predicted esterase